MAETAALTLTDFLLARFAEDEAVTRRSLRRLQGRPLAEERTMLRDASVHMLAHLAAARLIMELHGPHGQSPDIPCRELAALATIYAGHPDFREEWRP